MITSSLTDSPGLTCGWFRTDGKGQFSFLSIQPGGDALPSDGPVGRLMAALGCPLKQPAHIHFRGMAQGHEALTTYGFHQGDPATGRDAIFAVKPQLLADFCPSRTEVGAREHLLDLKLALCPLEQAET